MARIEEFLQGRVIIPVKKHPQISSLPPKTLFTPKPEDQWGKAVFNPLLHGARFAIYALRSNHIYIYNQ